MKPLLLLAAALTLAPLSFAENPHPAALAQPSPEFPDLADKPSRPVEVIVAYVVDQTGTTQQICVVRSTHRQFEKNATDAISRWRFQPAETNNRKIATRMTASFTLHADQTITSEIKPR